MSDKYKLDELQDVLQKRGARINRAKKEIDISRPKFGVVGIDTLGKLQFMRKNGYTVILPEVNMNPRKGYRGLSHA